MIRRKLSRLASLLGAAVIATLTFAVVVHAAGFYVFVSAPQEFTFSYSLAPGAKTGPVTPLAGIPNQIIGVDTTPGYRGVGEVSLLRIAGSFLEWTGLETPYGAAIASGFSGTVGTHIVFLDYSHKVQIEVNSPDSFVVHNTNTSGAIHTGVVDLWY
ncbi:MAG: hypothetical protein ACLQU2_09870 [Candidatus Binataceae bacterium]